jgi:hypothetical protein
LRIFQFLSSILSGISSRLLAMLGAEPKLGMRETEEFRKNRRR